jgi:hypothetical protein
LKYECGLSVLRVELDRSTQCSLGLHEPVLDQEGIPENVMCMRIPCFLLHHKLGALDGPGAVATRKARFGFRQDLRRINRSFRSLDFDGGRLFCFGLRWAWHLQAGISFRLQISRGCADAWSAAARYAGAWTRHSFGHGRYRNVALAILWRFVPGCP